MLILRLRTLVIIELGHWRSNTDSTPAPDRTPIGEKLEIHEQWKDVPRGTMDEVSSHVLIAVIEMSLSSWLVAGIVPGVERQPLKKLAGAQGVLLKLLDLWREEAEKAGYMIKRIAVAFEAGRDGFWLARWLGARDIEGPVIYTASVAVSREHRRAKTDRLDTELLKRAFLGWLRGERDHCKMVAIPTIKDEDG